MNPSVLALADSTAFRAGYLIAWLALGAFVWWLARSAARVQRRP